MVRLLVVCTGNICRSPMAAAVLRERLNDRVVIESAGLRPIEGLPVQPLMVDAAREFSLTAPAHESRLLTASMVEASDLVITMTRDQRARVAMAAPAAVRRTFTLRELARLLDVVGADDIEAAASKVRHPRRRLEAVLASLAAGRPRAIRAAPDEDDIPDPYGRGPAVYRAVLEAMIPAAEAVAAALAPVFGGPVPARGLNAPIWEDE